MRISTERFLDNITIIDMEKMIALDAAHGMVELKNMGREKHKADLVIAATERINNLRLVSFDNDLIDINIVLPFDLKLLSF